MKKLLAALIFCLSLSARAGVTPISGHGVTSAPPIQYGEREAFHWLVQVSSTYGEGPRAQRVSGYGFILRDPKTETFFVATASHLSQGKEVRLDRREDGHPVPVTFQSAVALNLADVEAFRIDSWPGIEPLADIVDGKLEVLPEPASTLLVATNLRGRDYLPVGFATFVPRVHPRGSDYEDFYLLGQDPDRIRKGGVDGTFLRSHFLRGFSQASFEALSHAPFASGMSGLPILEIAGNASRFQVTGLVSGRSRYHRHGWFVQAPPLMGALEVVKRSGRFHDSVQWNIHFGPEDYVLYRAGQIDGTDFKFEEVVSPRLASGEGSRSDSGEGSRSDSGGGSRSDSGGGSRSDSGDGPNKISSYETLGIGSGMAFGTPLKPTVAFLAEMKGMKTLLLANVPSLRILAQMQDKAKATNEPFSFRAIGPEEALLPLMIEHLKTNLRLDGEKPMPLMSHWIFQGDKLTGIGNLHATLEPKGDGAILHLDYLEGRLDLELTPQGTLKGDTGGFRPFLHAKNDKGALCHVNVSALLMVNPEMQNDLEKPQLKVTIACPDFQMYAEQYMGKL